MHLRALSREITTRGNASLYSRNESAGVPKMAKDNTLSGRPSWASTIQRLGTARASGRYPRQKRVCRHLNPRLSWKLWPRAASFLPIRNATSFFRRAIPQTQFSIFERARSKSPFYLANFGKEGRPEPLIAKINQETLAEMIGTTRSRVSHFMNKFRKAGFIDYNGHLEVHSSLLSVVLADQPRTVEPHGDAA